MILKLLKNEHFTSINRHMLYTTKTEVKAKVYVQ